jgi:hypothetical protein
VLPPEGGPFRQAEAALASGDYLRADQLYREMAAGDANEREIGLARRAFLLALPGTPVEDRETAASLLATLAAEFPETLLASNARALLAVLPDVDALRLSGERLEAALEGAREERELLARFLANASPLDPAFDAERARETYRTILSEYPDGQARRASERILFLLSQWERLGADTGEQQAELETLRGEIASLTRELERLKALDLGRRLPD